MGKVTQIIHSQRSPFLDNRFLEIGVEAGGLRFNQFVAYQSSIVQSRILLLLVEENMIQNAPDEALRTFKINYGTFF